jgi:TrmH family RNA methyltransferase
LRRLLRRADRREQQQFLAEGLTAVREAVGAARAGSAMVHEVLVGPEHTGATQEVVTLAAQHGLPVTRCASAVVDALSETVTPQGVLARCSFLDVTLDTVVAGSPSLVVVAAAVRDPGNAGSLLRAADAAGADAVVFGSGCVDPYNGKVVRASVGSLFHVPFVVDADVTAALTPLRAIGLQVLAADGRGDVDLDELGGGHRLVQPTAWIFGNEAWGLDDHSLGTDVLGLVDDVVRIPIYGRAESLNLATAATLCLYASARAQRA